MVAIAFSNVDTADKTSIEMGGWRFLDEMQLIAFRLMLSSCVCVCVCRVCGPRGKRFEIETSSFFLNCSK